MSKFILLLIFLTVITRLLFVNTIPTELSNDEISIAYDAYSILNSSRDEHGIYLPLSFKSHGTYKAPLYTYILVPFIKLFGNNNITVKLPSLISGFLTIFVIWKICFELTKNNYVSNITSVLLTITPWHIVLSRMALETSLALFFLSLGVLFFLQKKHFWSTFFFALSMYAYHTEWLFVPLLVLLLFSKIPFKYILLQGLLSLPLVFDFILHAGPGARANSEMIWDISSTNITLLGIVTSFLKNYVGYFDPSYLFFNGLNLLKSGHPFQPGLFLWTFIIPFAYGIINLKKNILPNHLYFFIVLILLSPVTAALTHGSPNLLRNFNTVLPLVIITAIGVKNLKIWWWGLTGISFILFLLTYFVNYPYEMAKTFQGYQPVAYYLKSKLNNNEVYIDYRYGDYRYGRDPEYIGVPHLYFGFYQKWDPSIIQKRTQLNDFTKFNNYYIGQIDWNSPNIFKKDRLYLVSMGNSPSLENRQKLVEEKIFYDASGIRSLELWKGK